MSSHKLSISCSRNEHPFDILDPVHQQVLGNDMDLWYAPLAPLHSIYEQLLAELDKDEVERAERFHFEKDRSRFVIGHYLLRQVLSHYTGEELRNIEFGRHEFGKPFMPQHPELHFNFSDTKDAILIGVSDHCQVGVDVETMQRNVDHEGVAEHFFTGVEIDELMNANDPKYRFLEFWTRKEAILKASGVGIMEDVRVLKVNEDEQEVHISHADMVALSAPRYEVLTGHIGEQNIISVATPEAIDRIGIFDPLQL